MITLFDSWWLWAGFFVFVVLAIHIDLFMLKSQGADRVGFREALVWTIFWIALSLAFNAGLWYYIDVTHDPALATVKATEFLTGYLIEKALSVDNIFAFYMVFAMFKVPAEYQKRALVIGIIGSILLRTVMILIGGVLVARFEWILYGFGAFLIYTGVKMLGHKEANDLEKNRLVAWARKHVRLTDHFEGEKLLVTENGHRCGTPILLAVMTIGLIDVVFAVDSIPAIFAITKDPFIVLTSNIFAVLGLRALYFLLADMVEKFRFLSLGLAVILIFIGAKMLIIHFYKIPIELSLGTVAAILVLSVVLSQIFPPKHEENPPKA